MGGDTGGNDCVHVIDVRVGRTAFPGDLNDLRPDTDVVIHDEHGGVSQFTYAEWDAFALKMKRDEFDHIGPDVTDALCGACQGTGNSGDPETNGKCWDCRGTGLYNGGERS